MLDHAFLIPLIPAVSFLLILGFGKRLPRGGAEIGIAALSICFVLSCAVGVGWIQRTNHPPTTGAHAAATTAAAAPASAEATPTTTGHGT
ncbi:MAG: proton-translocating NADH-quinone oxidoreductase, chain, partial [Acidimicrobiales bacterium]|nr:proton-translocating NADH-quinone oxidoreductase, chain [Acidimicrobiales bacterium]